MLKTLLEKGLFPSQLPPCFTGKKFAEYCESATIPNVAGAIAKNISAEKYSVARAGHFRRPTVIVNPHQYYFLAKEISDNKNIIEEFFLESSISKSTPRFVENESRSISILATRTLSELKLRTSAGYKYVLFTDIAQFFPSIYTHSIAWALYGKDKVKQALSKKSGITVPDLGDNLDLYTRLLKANQTIGIPIGPDSSHILAEIIGVALDKALLTEIPSLVGFRYVDDYTFYFDSFNEAEACLATLTRVLASFELNINATKTKIVEISEISSDYWTHELKSFSLSNRAKKQKRDILHFFDVALAIAKSNSDENVMKFALKKMAAKLIFPKNWPVFEANLLRVALIHPNTLIDVAHILYTYKYHNYPMDLAAVSRTINAIIRDHAPLGHHSEVSWALWIAAILEIPIPAKISDIACLVPSSPSILLLKHLHNKGLCENFSNKVLQEKTLVDGIYGDMWLAVYEARAQGFYLPSTNPLKDTLFDSMLKKNVRFFDINRMPKPLFKIKSKSKAASLLSTDWESYDEDDVEFEDIPDDYNDGYDDEDESDEDDDNDDNDNDNDNDDHDVDDDGDGDGDGDGNYIDAEVNNSCEKSVNKNKASSTLSIAKIKSPLLMPPKQNLIDDEKENPFSDLL